MTDISLHFLCVTKDIERFQQNVADQLRFQDFDSEQA